jgi:LAS superfamily LD-carboxypeptidase LdcB
MGAKRVNIIRVDTVKEFLKNPDNRKKIIITVSVLAAILVFALLFSLWRVYTLQLEEQSRIDGENLKAAAQTADEKTAQLAQQAQEQREDEQRTAQLNRLHERTTSFNESLLILVNPWNEVPEDYSVQLDTVEDFQVDRRCARQLAKMLSDCRAVGENYLPIICSAYRTQEYQEMLYRNKILRLLAEGVPNKDAPATAAKSVALPGTSEHQLGLAVDIISETYTNLDQWQERTPVQQWLMANCWRYGFILRYPNGTSETTGIIYEPWHYRFVGVETAKAVTESGLVFEDYLASLTEDAG